MARYDGNIYRLGGRSIVLWIGVKASDTLDIGFAKQIAVRIVLTQLLQRLLLSVWWQQGTLAGDDRCTETKQEFIATGGKIDDVGMPRQFVRNGCRLAQKPRDANLGAASMSDNFAQLARCERV